MRLGPRVAIVTTLLVAGVFAASTWALVRLRRADLERDLHRQAHAVAGTVVAGLEPLDDAGTHAALRNHISWAATTGGPFRLVAVAWGEQRPSNPWAGLVEEAGREAKPVGRLFTVEGGAPFFAMAIPIHNAPPGDARRHIVAYLGLQRDCDYIDREVAATVQRMLPVLLLGVLGLGVAIYLVLMSAVVNPLRRLVDAIDAVAKGDLSRAVLPGRDDEIGSLARRFNAMTEYLREARHEEARANAARLALETRLRHAEKLATIGQMAAEIAHEVGTPLNVIGGRARSLERRPAEAGEVQKNAGIISVQVERIAKIIRQVLSFSRPSGPTLTRVDVGRIVSEALDFVDETLRRQRIEVRVDAESSLPPIPGNPDEIQQVCLNLITNAVQAMPAGGKLRVRLDQVIRRKEELALAAPARFLLLEVSDTGAGVPVVDREKIFEAFFTTKDTGEGTGLGLAVSKGIVKDHDGWIEVDAHPVGAGAVFRVFLPIGAAADAADAQTSPQGTRLPNQAP